MSDFNHIFLLENPDLIWEELNLESQFFQKSLLNFRGVNLDNEVVLACDALDEVHHQKIHLG